MKSLTQYINEKLKIKKSKASVAELVPKNNDELYDMILEIWKNSSGYTHLDLTSIDVSNVNDLSYLFGQFRSVRTIDITGWDTSNCKSFVSMFSGCYNLEEIIGIRDIKFNENCAIDSMFKSCSELKKLDISNWDTKNIFDFTSLFYGCKNLEEIIGIENFDVSNARHFDYMFCGCKSLKTLDLSKWKPAKSNTFIYMFSGCNNLEEAIVPNLVTAATSNIVDMFGDCYALKKVDASNWDTSEVSFMTYIFGKCERLEEVKGIEHWDVSKVEQASSAFMDCVLLKADLSNWSMDSIRNKTKMFYHAKGIKKPARK